MDEIKGRNKNWILIKIYNENIHSTMFESNSQLTVATTSKYSHTERPVYRAQISFHDHTLNWIPHIGHVAVVAIVFHAPWRIHFYARELQQSKWTIYENAQKKCAIDSNVVSHRYIPNGRYDGITALAHDSTNRKASSCDGWSMSSKKIPPTPLASSRCWI